MEMNILENSAMFCTYNNLALVLNEGTKVVRNTLAKLNASGLIELQTTREGTFFQTTAKGDRFLQFTTKDVHEYGELLQLLRSTAAWRLLSIAQNIKLSKNK